MKNLIFLFIIFFLSNISFCQINSFYKVGLDSVNGNESIGFREIFSFNCDTSFILSGAATCYNINKRLEPILFKINDQGLLNFSKLIRSDNQLEVIYGIAITTQNNEILISGSYNSYHGFLIKSDQNGNLLWSRKYDSCVVKSMAVIGSSYYMAGFINKGKKNSNLIIVKTDTSGIIIWSKIIGGHRDENLKNIILTKESGILLIGNSSSIANSESDAFNSFVVKLDSSGNLQWAKVYDYIGQGPTWAEQVVETTDSSYVLYVKPQKVGHFFQSLMKIDKNGNVMWAKEYYTYYNNITYSNSFLSAQPNNEILSRAYIWNSEIDQKPLLLKTDSIGNVIWQKQFNSIENGLNLSMNDYSFFNNNFISVGSGNKNGYVFYEIIKADTANMGCITNTPIKTWTLDRQVLVTDLDTISDINIKYADYPFEVIDIDPKFRDVCVITGENKKLMVNTEQLIIYPNPATTTIHIAPPTNTGTIQITDINGIVILTMPIKELKENVNVIALPQGLYFVRAITGGSVYNGRFVKIAE